MFFTKYLPAKGKTESNQWQWFNNIQNTGWESITPSDMDAVIAHGLQPSPKFRKVKLFLCSRDIQVGDKVFPINGDGTKSYNVPNEGALKPFQEGTISGFKVIGEISPDAIWVKEGDEFIAEDLKWAICETNEYFEPVDYCDFSEMEDPSEDDRIMVIGPCGHFH